MKVPYPSDLVPDLLWIQKEARDMWLADTPIGSIRREQYNAKVHEFSDAFWRYVESSS